MVEPTHQSLLAGGVLNYFSNAWRAIGVCEAREEKAKLLPVRYG